MNISLHSYQRCLKNFKPMQIVAKFSDKNNSEYWILDKNKNPVGKFDILGSDISKLWLAENIRRKKTAANAILSVREFVCQKAKENNWDFVTFTAEIRNPDNVKKLYQQLGAEYIGRGVDGENFVGIFNNHQKTIILDRLNLLNTVSNSLQKINTILCKLLKKCLILTSRH